MLIPIILGSERDQDFAEKIIRVLDDFGVPHQEHILSAHKVPEKLLAVVKEYNKSNDAICYITVAGRSNSLSGVVAGSSVHPVIACPPFSSKEDYLINIHSTLQMPSETPVLTVIEPKNAALAALRILANSDPDLRLKIEDHLKLIKKTYSK